MKFLISLINRLSSNRDAPENRNSNKIFDESEPVPSYAKRSSWILFDHDCYLLRRHCRPKNEGHMLKERWRRTKTSTMFEPPFLRSLTNLSKCDNINACANLVTLLLFLFIMVIQIATFGSHNERYEANTCGLCCWLENIKDFDVWNIQWEKVPFFFERLPLVS